MSSFTFITHLKKDTLNVKPEQTVLSVDFVRFSVTIVKSGKSHTIHK